MANEKINDIKGNKKLINSEKDELVEAVKEQLKEINKDLTIEKVIEQNPVLSLEQLQQKINEKKEEFNRNLETIKPNEKTAKDKVIEELTAHKNEIISNLDKQDLTEEEKQERIKVVEESLENAISQITKEDNLTENSLNTLKELHTEKMNKNDELVSLKQQKIKNINDDNSLVQSEKNKLLEKVEEKLKEAKENVKKASKKDDITQIENDLKEALSGINHVGPKIKEVAKDNIDKYFEQQKNTINQDNKFTTDEKRELIEKIQQEVNKAKNTIEKTPINDVNPKPSEPKLNDLLEEGKRAVGNVISANPASKKDQAVEEIEEEKEKLSEKINNLPTTKKISDKDKEYYKEKTKDIVDTDINNIKTEDLSNLDVSNKKELAKAKLDAAEKIIDALVEKTNEINSNSKLSANEKANEITKIRQIAEAELDKIKQAQSTAEVNPSKTIEDINNYVVKPAEKQNIINQIESEKAKKIDEINKRLEAGIISQNEKDDYIKKVNDAANAAIKKINEDENISEENLQNYKNEAKTEIDKVKPLGLDNIKAQLQKMASDKINDIRGNEKLINSEKDKLVKDVEDQLKEINKNLTIEKVIEENPGLSLEELQQKINEKTQEFSENLENIKPNDKTAKDKVIDELTAHKDKILSNLDKENLTDAEKQERKNVVEEALKKAISQITKEDNLTEDSLNTLKELHKEKMNKNDELVSLKHQKIKNINDDNSLIQSEKNLLLTKVEEETKKSIDKVNQAETKDIFENSKEELQETLNNIQHNGEKAKETSKKNIDQYLKDKTDTIQNDHNLTTDEKAKAIKAINDIAEAAKQKIDTTKIDDTNLDPLKPTVQLNALVEETKENIDEKIKENPASTKPNALKEIEDKKNELLNKNKDLKDSNKITEKDKEYYNSKLDINNESINDLTTNNDLSDKNVSDKKDLILKKFEEVDKIIDSLVKKTNEINENKKLTATEKEEEIKAIRDIADKQIDNIKKATDIAQINSDDTIKSIDEYRVNPLAKQNAIAEINKEKDKKIKEIEDKFNKCIITEAEKDNFIEEVNDIAKNAINKIEEDKNISDESLSQNKTDAINSISNVKPLGLENLKAKLEKLVNENKNNINKNSNYIQEEKDKLIEQVDEKYNEITNTLNLDDIIRDNPNLTLEQLQEIIDAKEQELNEKLADVSIKEKTEKQIAIDELIKHKEEKLKEIEKISDENEKNERKNVLENLVNLLIDQIYENNDLNKQKLDSLKDLSIKKIDTIDDLVSKKHENYRIVDNSQNQKLLTFEEKLSRKNSISQEIENAIEKVSDAQTQEDIPLVLSNNEKAISDIINNENNYKKDIEKQINLVLETKKQKINQNNDLSDKEKEDYINEITTKANNFINSFKEEKDSHQNVLESQKDDIIDFIKEFKTPAKDKARKLILDAYNKKVAKISNPKDKRFTKEEKDLQINDLNILHKEALDAILISETNDDLQKVIDEFINENTGLITTYNKEPNIKPLSIKALEEAKKKKEEEIMYSYQTDKGKDIALKQLNQLYNNYINDIKNANKNILVENHKEKAILLINGIKIINDNKDNSLLDKPIIKNIVNQNKKTKTKNRLYLYSIFLTPAAFMTILFIIYKKRKNNNNNNNK